MRQDKMKAFLGHLSLQIVHLMKARIEINYINVHLSLALLLLTFNDHEIIYWMEHLLANYLSFIRC